MSQIASRQIAIATVIEACKRRQLLSNAQARYPIYVVADLFWISVEQYSGVAILTPDALFLVRTHKLHRATGTTGDDLAPCAAALLEMRHEDIPSILRDDAAWPKTLPGDAEVAVLMRDHLRSVAPVPFTPEIEFLSNATPVRICCRKGDEHSIAQLLRDTGWIRSAPAPETPPIVSGAMRQRDYRPAIVAGVCAAVVAVIVVITRVDAISPTMAMLLCIPLLAGAVFAISRLLSPPRTGGRDQPG